MELKEIIQKVRERLLKGQTEEALSVLGTYLDQQGTPAIDNYNRVIQLTAQYQQTKRSEQANLLAFDDAQVVYSQINNALLSLVKELETPERSTKLNKKRRLLWPALLVGLLLVTTAAYFLWPSQEEESCPSFRPDTDFDILVLPFKPIGAEEVTPAHTLFEIGLNRLIDDNELTGEANVESYAETIASTEDYPTGVQAARMISQNCGTQLIIWGITEKLAQSGKTILTTDYLFLDEESIHIDRQELGMDAELSASDIVMKFPERGQQRDTISSFSSITENLPSHLESRLKFLLGVFAHEKGNNIATQQLLEEWPEEPLDPESTQIWATLLADSYLKTNEEEKAAATYSKLIEADPDNTLARNNRALLYYKKGEYAMAIQDLNTNLKNNRQDTVALTTRSYIFLKEGMLRQAEEDLERAKELDPNRPVIRTWEAKLDARKRQEEQSLKNAEEQLKEKPNNVKALLEKATASINLGDYNIARKTAEKVISINPKSIPAYKILQETDFMLNQDSRRTLQRAKSNGIPSKRVEGRSAIMRVMPKE